MKQEDLCTGIAFIYDDKFERRETSNGGLGEWAISEFQKL